ncbi:hypothetical protein ATCC90586_005408 [Pythium insidiosum]|nr:hypothetical protein ATCC90586_005408 [Pythium insidiosum]
MADPVVLVKMLGVLLAVGLLLALVFWLYRYVQYRRAVRLSQMRWLHYESDVMANTSERRMDWPSMKPLMLSPIPEERGRESMESLSSVRRDLRASAVSFVSSARDDPTLVSSSALDALALALQTDLVAGLDPNRPRDLELRARWFGRNALATPRSKTLWDLMFAAAFQDSTNVMLMAAGVASLALGMYGAKDGSSASTATAWVEGACVLIAVSAIVVVTALTEFKKEAQFQQLSRASNDPIISVVRGGTQQQVLKSALLVGDIVVLRTGDIVPADGVVLAAHALRIDESMLTGESEAVTKQAQRDVVWSGTSVVDGSGRLLVLAVGDRTQEGALLRLAQGASFDHVSTCAPEGAVSIEMGEPSYHNLASPTGSKAVAQEHRSAASRDMRTPMALKLERLNLTMGKIGAVVATLVFVVLSVRFSINTFLGDNASTWNARFISDYISFFILAVTILVVAIPEGLPLAVVIALTVAVRRMLNENNLVRHLYACETAGNATILCTDKTGTLTTNEMSVTALWMHSLTGASASWRDQLQHLGATPRELLELSLAINSTAEIVAPSDDQRECVVGSASEGALLRCLRDELHVDYRTVRQSPQYHIDRVVPFSSVHKFMATELTVKTARHGDLSSQSSTSRLVLVKGAPEVVLPRCSALLTVANQVVPIEMTTVNAVVQAYSSSGRRTLCLAYRRDDSQQEDPICSLEASSLVCLAIVGIEDPMRPEVPRAISCCQSAGVRVCMVTGDNALTASSIARQCGILPANADSSMVMEASVFRQRVLIPGTDGHPNGGEIDEDAFDEVWPSLRVLARATPLDKYVLVRGLKATTRTQYGPQLVAVTGDGTNDAPALKTAHVGFAMGRGGTEVAKRASDIVVLDDNVLSIVRAIEWGRNVYDAIAKFLQFQLTVISVAVTLAVVGSIALSASPLTATQILWVNLFMDAFVSLSLATERPTASVMARAPHSIDTPLISARMAKHIVGQSLFQIAALLILRFSWRETTEGVTSTVVFNTFAWMQLFNQFNCRRIDDDLNILRGAGANRALLIGWPMQAGLQVAAVQLGGELFHCVALSRRDWLACVGIAALTLPLGWLLRLHGSIRGGNATGDTTVAVSLVPDSKPERREESCLLAHEPCP